MKIVYLDQNKWIDLARVAHGKNVAMEMKEVLAFVRGARDMGLACFPLSLTHYMETLRIGRLERRLRLAAFMREYSGGITIVAPGDILRYEIESALSQRFPQWVRPQRVRPLALLGRGYWHADGRPDARPTLPAPDLESLSPKSRRLVRHLQALLDEVLEIGVLSGVSILTGQVAPRPDFSKEESGLKSDLEGLQRLNSLDAQTQENVLYLLCIRDIVRTLALTIERHCIPMHEISALEFDGCKKLIDALPSQRVIMHLLRQWVKNRALKANRSDFYDWMALAGAVAYCDVLVTEKRFADLVKREGFQERAKVITDLRQLPLVLTDLSR